MANKMLIDSSHPEETRVVVTRGHKVEEFDFESANRRQLRGNIYLAKVTRVEPSLQAAFIEYGGNRHGFLAFSEIHPDYYQIPIADRQALLEADARAEAESAADEERPRQRRRRSGRRSRGDREGGEGRRDEAAAGEETAATREMADDDRTLTDHDLGGGDETSSDAGPDDTLNEGDGASMGAPDDTAAEASAPADDHRTDSHDPDSDKPESGAMSRPMAAARDETVSAEIEDEHPGVEPETSDGSEDQEHVSDDRVSEDHVSEDHEHVSLEAHALNEDDETEDDDEDEELEEHEVVEDTGGTDALEEVPDRPRSHRRHYKIQEVIKRRQILLVQVVKEERGNKGAALTTYLSLAGRYSVLMPNTGKGGGISRKITSAEDRKRLKEVVEDLDVPDGMGVILRTAGANRTKAEIKRDYEYLMRLWESVRELTLSSSAPALVYEEGSLIKRAIRDLYNKDIDDILVSGEEGYSEARDFIRMIMPSQAKLVQPYREPQPLFAHFGIEAQLDAMFSSHVTLKSGGYLVINPTEALVSIDVNSGRSTREHNIEDTALRTNLEASEEISRQLRLRDLAGLIVIDFIDMEENRNNRAVEKKLKDCLKNDRARIQVGRISPFGLLEMSRQRIRTGVLESSSLPCRHCAGTGFVRATPSVALQVLRSAEESLLRSASHNLVVRTRTEVAFYILNQKRAHLSELETRFGAALSIVADETLAGTTTFAIERGDPAVPPERKAAVTGVRIDAIMPVDEPIEIEPTAEYERARDLDESVEDESSHDDRTHDEGEPTSSADGAEAGEDGSGRRKRRRRRRRGRGGEREFSAEGRGDGDESEESSTEGSGEDALEGEEDDPQGPTIKHRGRNPATREAGEAHGSPVLLDDLAIESDAALLAGSIAPPRQEEIAPAEIQAPAVMSGSDDVVRPNALTDIEAGGPDADPGPLTDMSAVADAAGRREPEPEPVHVVLTEPDPDRPKRGGWWSKAKAALGGN